MLLADLVVSGLPVTTANAEMAPSPTLLSLQIILLLASHFGNTLPPPALLKDGQADNRVDSQTTVEGDSQQQQVETSEFPSVQ